MRKLAGTETAKLYPRLRMVLNGSTSVNAKRAELDPSVRVASKKVLPDRYLREPQQRALTQRAVRKKLDRGHLAAPSDDILVSVFVELKPGRHATDLPVPAKRRLEQANLVRAEVSLEELVELVESPAVQRVDPGQAIKFSPPEDEGDVPAPPVALRRFGDGRSHGFGDGVLIGIIDVQGFDFSHADFLDDNGKTRFVSIWDQAGTTRPHPGGFDYGSEILKRHMDAAIDASRDATNPDRAAPYLLEPQTQMSMSSHATHVASIAAGNRGICRRAMIAGVLVSLPNADLDRRRSFYDSSRISDAVDYLVDLGNRLGVPVSINVSLGTNGHAHDASSAVSRWLDFQLTQSGRCICVAAGNAGQESPTEPGDSGFIMGRIHTSGTFSGAGLIRNIEWIVVGDGITDISENEFEVWYSPQDRFAVELISPSGVSSGAVEPTEFIENRVLPGGTVISIYNEIYSSINGDNQIAIYLSPFFGEPGEVIGIEAGTWTVRIYSQTVRDGRYHAWIERDDPRRIGVIGMLQAWSFPSFFSAASNVDHSSVSSLACGQRIVGVANLDAERERIHVTSSQGPTRDGRWKPEICAPGTGIAAASGFNPLAPWTAKTGTSMASPFVAGVAGLMLAVENRLTAAQIMGIMRRTAQPLPGHDHAWRDDAGFGRIVPDACIEEAANAFGTKDKT